MQANHRSRACALCVGAIKKRGHSAEGIPNCWARFPLKHAPYSRRWLPPRMVRRADCVHVLLRVCVYIPCVDRCAVGSGGTTQSPKRQRPRRALHCDRKWCIAAKEKGGMGRLKQRPDFVDVELWRERSVPSVLCTQNIVSYEEKKTEA